MRYLLVALFMFFPGIVLANGLVDSDFDGVPDRDEIEIYKTNPNLSDTDGDGYSDWIELTTGYTPLEAKPLRLEDSDFDGDGLSDKMELNFKTDIGNSDTDGDGFSDGGEVHGGYDPLLNGGAKLEKRIDISIYSQKLYYFMGGVLMFETPVSSGIYDTTPKGQFHIENKHPKAWSSYGLWMPYWMALTPDGKYGIHELPIWPSGYREGEDHLGTPVSHGCVRVGMEAAERIYNLTEVGTEVNIY
ncbi:MAG: L,D-transpeptidase family protein [Patescibacteria group bacterium]|jgi:hypothetical protein|nr:L,D-transpeptidase family protein [Patescibacteria group bacterium]